MLWNKREQDPQKSARETFIREWDYELTPAERLVRASGITWKDPKTGEIVGYNSRALEELSHMTIFRANNPDWSVTNMNGTERETFLERAGYPIMPIKEQGHGCLLPF